MFSRVPFVEICPESIGGIAVSVSYTHLIGALKMKTAIVYASVHHGNTKKIIDEIAKTKDVELLDATQTVEKDLSEYDLIGFASGVYGGCLLYTSRCV